MTTLIVGASYTPTEEKRALAVLWAKVLEKLSPDPDILVIDCNSPFRPSAFLKPMSYETVPLTATSLPRRAVMSFRENVGHLSGGGKDGWGRSFSKAIEVAMACGYHWLAYIETDVLFSEPVTPIIKKMTRCDVKVACPPEYECHFAAHEISFYNVDYLRKIKFVEKYDWQTSRMWSTETREAYRPPEKRWEEIFADDLFFLPIRGCRNGNGLITTENMEVVYPMGLSWITHCRDFSVYEAFLKRNNIDV